MKANISKGTIGITGKLSEENKIIAIIEIMALEFDSLCLMENHGKKSGGEMAEYNICYSPEEATVETIKDSYREAKAAV